MTKVKETGSEKLLKKQKLADKRLL